MHVCVTAYTPAKLGLRLIDAEIACIALQHEKLSSTGATVYGWHVA